MPLMGPPKTGTSVPVAMSRPTLQNQTSSPAKRACRIDQMRSASPINRPTAATVQGQLSGANGLCAQATSFVFKAAARDDTGGSIPDAR